MIAILLYVIGLVSAVVTVVLVGFEAADIWSRLWAAYESGLGNVLPALAHEAVGLAWAFYPFLGGLLLMGFGRIILLLGAIRHALKGPA